MSTTRIQGIAAAVLLATFMIATAPSAADEPVVLGTPGETSSMKPDAMTDNALRRTPLPATRPADRAHCRDLAARRKLFGLRRHKFLQRCRRARRKIAPAAPAAPHGH